MIWESGPWKDDLLRRASAVDKRIAQKRWHASTYARIEQDLMLGFYSIRKLDDASKLSDSVAQQQVDLLLMDPTGITVTKMNWHRLDELYDFETQRSVRKPLRFVCNQMIHSYVFTVAQQASGGLEGVFFASDVARKKGLFFMSAAEIIRVFEVVGNDYPASVRWEWNPKQSDYEMSAS